MRCYFAGKSRHWPFIAALRAAGVPVISSWLDWAPNRNGSEPSSDQYREHSERCLREAAECDVLVLFAQDCEQQFGSLLEAGSALGAGKQVFLISSHEWPFLRHHPQVHSFDTLEAAVTALLAWKAGEAARAATARSPCALSQ